MAASGVNALRTYTVPPRWLLDLAHAHPRVAFLPLTLRAAKPKPAAYPRQLSTLGDHLRKRRLDLGLLQKDVARRVGVKTPAVTAWELGQATPSAGYLPRIIRFLG
jgi:DNA-binding XRE family transcriptional regulator